ncbi:MAG TPA: sodium:proton antiporter, partial [Thermoanaerobaculia bacterium]
MAPPLGAQLPAWSVLPFAGLLLSIALFPLAGPNVWHRHYAKVALFWGALFAVPFVFVYGAAACGELLHTAIQEYLPFLVLLAALYTIGGGIYVRGSLAGTPWTNAAILGIGAAIASLVGTTGAAMLLIRPLLRANAHRRHRTHTVVFFVFLVANIGGGLTPLGDPPLFLGFLSGVPFFWTLSLGPELLVVAALVLAIYLAVDLRCYAKHESAELRAAPQPPLRLRILGAHNLVLLLVLLAAVIASGVWHPGEVTILGVHEGLQDLLRDLV